MNQHNKASFYLGDWCVIPDQCRLQNSQDIKHLQPKLMEVLLYLADHPSQVISMDELISACWLGMPISDNPIHKTIAELRKALGDSTEQPKYIKTIPRKGYMLIAKVSHKNNFDGDTEPFWQEGIPFLGNQPMLQKHAEIFFARETALADVTQMIARLNRADRALIQLSGSSGCGKTSFIQAGVIPKLLNPYKPFKISFTQALCWDLAIHSGTETLRSSLQQQAFFSDVFGAEQLPQDDAEKPRTVQADEEQLTGSEQRLIVFIDQIEHWMFDPRTEDGSPSRIDDLMQLIDTLYRSGKCLLVLSARDEASQELTQRLERVCHDGQLLPYRLPEMSGSEKMQWLKKTFQAAGLFFAVNAARQTTLLDQISQLVNRYHLSLSTLQVLFQRLCEGHNSSELSFKDYQDMGGIEGIMGTHHEHVFKQLTPEQQAQVSSQFPALIGFESIEHQRPVLKYPDWVVIQREVDQSILTRLLDLRILKSNLRGAQIQLSFNEKNMVYLWPRLGDWIEAHQNLLIKQVELKLMAIRWVNAGKHPAACLNVPDFQRLVTTPPVPTSDQSDSVQEFIAHSKTHIRRHQASKLSAIMLGVACALGMVWFWYQEQKTEHQWQQTQAQLMGLSTVLTEQISPQLKQAGALELMQRINQEVIGVYASQQNALTAKQWAQYMATYNQLGTLSVNQREDEQAADFFTAGIALAGQSAIIDHPGVLNQKMLSHYWLGHLAFNHQEFSVANTHWQAYLALARQLRDLEPDQDQWVLEHSYALNNLGSLAEKSDQLDSAERYFSQSIALKTALLSRKPDDQLLIADLADSWSWQGNVLRKKGALGEALKAYEDSRVLTASLVDDASARQMKLHRESLALHRMASVTFDLGFIDQAQTLATEAIGKSQQLNLLAPEQHNHKKELLGLHLLNATIDRHAGDPDAALQHIQQASQLIEFFKLNLRMSPRISAMKMRLKLEQALLFYDHEQPESALQAIEEGMQLWNDQAVAAQRSAQLAYVMLCLNQLKILDQVEQTVRQVGSRIQLDHAWAQITAMLEDNPQSQQLMAIYLALSHARKGDISHHEFVRLLKDSEYRNPEFYQPLIEEQLITFH
ncbi:winged helix-turn-helix domain-containing protein [Marinicella sediminis]|uniref:Winged helix-turn-helix domain-containing protein n=1 Tax=Marinicella sediminis TaxID=1792834 RepID=A0ABV7JFM2_9GAMM